MDPPTPLAIVWCIYRNGRIQISSIDPYDCYGSIGVATLQAIPGMFEVSSRPFGSLGFLITVVVGVSHQLPPAWD